jgi:lipoprotein signal peptidase
MGATNVSPEIAFTVGGQDVTDRILAPGELDETAFTFVLGGGLRGNVGDTFLVEVAFKFFDIMTEQELSLNKLSFAIGA